MQLLIEKGWTMYYSCFCQGSKKEYWTHKAYPGYEIRTRPTKNTVSILHKNLIIFGPNWGYKLAGKLNEYGING